jgi:hypothetical protein
METFPSLNAKLINQRGYCVGLSAWGLPLEQQRFFIPFLLPALLFALATISQNRRKEPPLISKKAFSKLRNVGLKYGFFYIACTCMLSLVLDIFRLSPVEPE